MTFWKTRADVQDRYRRTVFTGVVTARSGDDTYDVLLPGMAEPVRGVWNATGITFQQGNRVVVQRLAGRQGWQIQSGVGQAAPGEQVNPSAVLAPPAAVYWDALARDAQDPTTIAGYIAARQWPLSALTASGAADGQVPRWDAAQQAWLPATPAVGAGGSQEGAAGTALAALLTNARPAIPLPWTAAWYMDQMSDSDTAASRGAFVYTNSRYRDLRGGAYALDAGTLACWKMDEINAGDTVLDCTAANLDLTPYSLAAPLASAFHGARQFNGASSYAMRGNLAVHGRATLTVEAWIKPDALANNPMLVHQSDSFSLQFDGGGTTFRLMVVTTAGYVACVVPVNPAALLDGGWHYLAGVYDGAFIRMYLDGQPVGTPAAQSGNVRPGAGAGVYLGVYAPLSGSLSRYYDGYLQEVRVSTVARGAGEIAAAWDGLAAQAAISPALITPASASSALLGAIETNGGGTAGYAISNDDGATWHPATPWRQVTLPTPGTAWRVKTTLAGRVEVERLGVVVM